MATVTSTNCKDLAPIRRISYKDDDRKEMLVQLCEKDDFQNTTSHRSFDVPTRPSTSTLCATDVEGQHKQDSPFSPRARWRMKVIECTTVFLVLLVWMLLIMGVLILTDSLFPTALRSYYKFKELHTQLLTTTLELDGLKAQLSRLHYSVGKLGSMTIQKLRR